MSVVCTEMQKQEEFSKDFVYYIKRINTVLFNKTNSYGN